MKSALIVAALMEHIMEEAVLGFETIALAMKEEWTGKRGLGLFLGLLGYIRRIRKKKMITERTLKRWRNKALTDDGVKEGVITLHVNDKIQLNKRILRMTQELLDLHLIRK